MTLLENAAKQKLAEREGEEAKNENRRKEMCMPPMVTMVALPFFRAALQSQSGGAELRVK